jgi:hypothetical protein
VPPAIILLSFLPSPPLLLSSPLLSSKPNFATLMITLHSYTTAASSSSHTKSEREEEQKKQKSKVSHFLSPSLLRRLSPHCDRHKEKKMKPAHSIKRKVGVGKKSKRKTKTRR